MISKFTSENIGTFADIADMAAKNGLHALAELLLDREPNLSRQVDVLLRLKQVDKALKIADQSQQPDLCKYDNEYGLNNNILQCTRCCVISEV